MSAPPTAALVKRITRQHWPNGMSGSGADLTSFNVQLSCDDYPLAGGFCHYVPTEYADAWQKGLLNAIGVSCLEAAEGKRISLRTEDKGQGWLITELCEEDTERWWRIPRYWD